MAVHRIRRSAALVLTFVVGAAACATHEAAPAFRRSVFFDDRGISVPLPPPSIVEAEVEGTTEGKDPIVAGTKVFIEDIEGDAAAELTLAAGATSFKVKDLEIKVADHCFEVWLETPDGRQSERFYIRGHLRDEATFETVTGCE